MATVKLTEQELAVILATSTTVNPPVVNRKDMFDVWALKEEKTPGTQAGYLRRARRIIKALRS